MPDLLTLAGGFLAFFAFLFVARFLAVFLQFLRMPIWPTTLTALDIMPELSPDQQAAVRELEDLGFSFAAAHRIEHGPLAYSGLLLRHRTEEAFANLTFSRGFATAYPIEFYSFNSAGTAIVTVNRIAWLFVVCLPGVEMVDAFAKSAAEHWQSHQARLPKIAIADVSEDDVQARIKSAAENYLPLMREAGAVTEGRGVWHPTVRSAWRITQAWWAIRRKLAQPYLSTVVGGSNRSAYFASCYKQVEAVNAAKPTRPNVTAAILIVSLAVSFLFWGNIFDWRYAAILIAVLLVHETGHALAMRAFGYRDISMFFIPFFGAAVTGTSKEMPAWKQAVVLLAGPMPGLIAAAAFFLYRGFYPFEDGGFDWGSVALVAGFVNLMNLLPLTPLDGGRLLEISVFGRWPKARPVFSIGSVAIGAAIAVWQQDFFLWALVILIAITLPGQWRTARLQGAWQDGLAKNLQIERLFEAARAFFPKLSFTRQFAIVKAVFTQRKIAHARIWENAIVVAILVGVWGGVGVAAIHLWPRSSAAPAIADTRAEPQKTFDAAFDAFDDDDVDAPTLSTLEPLMDAIGAHDPRRVDFEVIKAQTLPAPERRAQFELILNEGRAGLHVSQSRLIALLLDDVYTEAKTKPLAGGATLFGAAIDRVDAISPDAFALTAPWRIQLAALLDKNGDATQALAVIKSLKSKLIEKHANVNALRQALIAEAWFYVDHNEVGHAQSLLEEAMSNEMRNTRDRLVRDYAWSLLFAGENGKGVEQMRYAAYSTPPKPTFLQNALGQNGKRKLVLPLDLSYALLKNGDKREAVQLIAVNAPWVCRHKPTRSGLPWRKLRDQAIADTQAAVCSEVKAGP